jgi:hypothetical protein
MSWSEEIEPMFMKVHNIQVLVKQTRIGTKLHISFSQLFYKELGEPKRVIVRNGTGENEGKVQLQFQSKGKTEVKEFPKGGARIIAKAPDWVTKEFNLAPIPAELLEKSHDYIIIALPRSKWEETIREVSVPEPESESKSVRHLADNILDGKINATNYLRGKGHIVSVSELGVYSIDKRVRDRLEVLKMINRHREVQELPPITLDQVDWKLTSGIAKKPNSI